MNTPWAGGVYPVVPLRRFAQKRARPVRAGAEVVTAFRDGFVGPRSMRREDGFTFSDQEQGYQGVEAGDLVFHGLDGFAGAFGVAVAGGKCSPVCHVITFEEDDPRYVAYALTAAADSGWLEVQVPSTRQRAVDFRNWATFAALPAPRPAPDTQRAVADFLDAQIAAIDDLLALKAAQGALLTERFVAERRAVLTALERLHGTVALRYVMRCLDGQRVPLNAVERATRQGAIPYWGAGSIVDHVDAALFDEELVLLGEDGAPFFDRLRDVAYKVEGPIWVNNHIHVLRPVDGWHPAFMAHSLNAVDYAAYITGATRDKLTQEDMREIRLPNVPTTEQRVVAEALDGASMAVSELRADIRQSIDLLIERRVTLIAAAVTGRLDVTSARKVA